MARVAWTSEAYVDLDAIALYVGERNPAAAERLAETIWSAAERLGDQPFAYRSGREPGTREAVVHPNYIVVYSSASTSCGFSASCTPAASIREAS